MEEEKDKTENIDPSKDSLYSDVKDETEGLNRGSKTNKKKIPKEKKKISWKSRLKNYFIWVLILSCGGIFLWKQIEIWQMEKAEIEKIAKVKKVYLQFIQRRDGEFLSLYSKPLSWALRTEMLKENYEQVDDYVRQVIKEHGFTLIVVLDAEGKVIVSSDKKIEGENLTQIYPQVSLNVTKYQMKTVGDKLFVVTPIMGYEKKIGTLFFIYEPEKVPVDEPKK